MRCVKVSVRPVLVRGNRQWVVSWKPSGAKRQRRYFPTKSAAATEAEDIRTKTAQMGEVWLGLTGAERSELISVVVEARARGLNLRDVWERFKIGLVEATIAPRTIRAVIDESIVAKSGAGGANDIPKRSREA